jgi:hypothetical protein
VYVFPIKKVVRWPSILWVYLGNVTVGGLVRKNFFDIMNSPRYFLSLGLNLSFLVLQESHEEV